MVELQDWGLIDYELGLKRQLELVELVASGKSPEVLVTCSHPPVVTVGRKTQPGDIFAWQGNTVEVSRGGRATYHGPSQLVVYPILNLELQTPHRPKHDVIWVLRTLESSLVETLLEFGITAQGKQKADGPLDLEDTGVWIKDKKIASVGIAVKRWVCYHGMAINIESDPSAFQGMNPCGYQASVMTNLEAALERRPDRQAFRNILTEKLMTKL